MVNNRVDGRDGLLKALAEEGVQVDPRREDHDYGRFAWIMDPDSNGVELMGAPQTKSSSVGPWLSS
jgi:hypothetical protein